MLRHFKCNLQYIVIHSVVSGRKLQYAVSYVSILKTKSANVRNRVDCYHIWKYSNNQDIIK